MKFVSLIAAASVLFAAPVAAATTRPGQAMPTVGKTNVRASTPAKHRSDLAGLGLAPFLIGGALIIAVVVVVANQSNG